MAANAFDKSPYLNNGMPDDAVPVMEDEDIEIEVEPDPEDPNDETVTIDMDEPDKNPLAHDANLAEFMGESDLRLLAMELLEDVEEDLRSRSEWEKTYKDGLRLLGLKQETRSEPWENACAVIHPVMAEAVVRFQAEMVTETFPPHGPVKTKVLGLVSPAKQEAADRVREDMNIELTDRMTEYRAEHERLLWNLPIAGSGFKKIYYDPTLQRQTSMFVAAEDFIVHYGASDLQTCGRYTQRMKKTKNDLKKLMVSGFYKQIELSEPTPEVGGSEVTEEKDRIAGVVQMIHAEHYTLLEINVDLDLKGFEDPLGIALPYIVTIDKESQMVLAIRRNWKEDDETRKRQQYFVHYTYITGFGFYGFGLIHLVGGFADSATSLLRQLVDAGTLSNLPGGLKTRGLRIKGDDTPIAPGEWRDVDILSGTLKENLLPLPYKEPSAVLAALLDKVVEEGRKFAAVAEMKVSDFDSNSPVGTTMALLERTLKVMSSVQSRIYEAMKYEFRIIKGLIAAHGPQQYEYDPETGDKSMKAADYASVDALPVADPNAATMSQRIVQWQAVMQLAAMAPQVYDLPELHARMLSILGIKEVAKLIPSWKESMEPMDPVSENMAIMTGKPVKAFITQDHMAHISVHQMAMQDPKLMQLIGQNPMAAQIQSAAMAHLMEHAAFAYRQQMEQALGVPLPPPDTPMPPEDEARLASLLVPAAQKLLGMNQNEAAAAAAKAAQEDPVLQMQQRETAVKEAEVKRKAAKDAADIEQKDKELALREKEIDLNAAGRGVEIGSRVVLEKQRIEADKQKHADQVASTEKQTAFRSAVDATNRDKDREHKTAESDKAAQRAAQQPAKPEKDKS